MRDIGNTFDATTAGAYTGPEAGKEITSTFTAPTGLYTPGTIGNTFDAEKHTDLSCILDISAKKIRKRAKQCQGK